MPIPDSGQELLDDIIGSLQAYSVKGMSEFDERRLQRDIDLIPDDHFRFMCWGMFYALKEDYEKSVQYHTASIKAGMSHDGYRNFEGSLYYLGHWDEVLAVTRQWYQQLPALESQQHLIKALFYNGFYMQAHALCHDHPDFELRSSIDLMVEVLGASYEQEYARLHQAFIRYCFHSGQRLLPQVTPIGLEDPDTGQKSMVLQVFHLLEDEVRAAQLVPSFLDESEIFQEVSFELIYRVSFSVKALKS